KYSIGGHLYNAKVYLESPELFAWTSVVIVLSFAFEYLFKRIASKMTNHGL
ncbi:MAG: nitrate ABC transporter permease, partial [Clostridiales bacterium]|nr:nitrate ABC transporter permease [Clostridiales bacterium]